MDILQEQIDYYRARAGEYDEWWLRQGRYDRGPEFKAQWLREIDQVRAALDEFAPRGNVLELACGTGNWSVELARFADRLTLVDSSPEVLALNAARLEHPRVTRIQADLFSWRPTESYDVVFFSFWLSHVPPAAFADFWRSVQDALAPNGRVCFIDSLDDALSTARDQTAPERRRLNDGREFQIVKIYYQPAELAQRLKDMGWQADVRSTPHYFLFGSARLMPRML
jgi:demethylmenaquinone methyltransferase/2-methoxy-6-polyprenyl-1,4-benzoquinol methylase